MTSKSDRKNIYKNNTKNIDKSIEIENGFFIIKNENLTSKTQEFRKDIALSIIQFHFCLNEKILLQYNNGAYTIEVLASKSMLLYNPTQMLPMHVLLPPGSVLLSIIIPIDKLHSFFSDEANMIHFLEEEHINKKYYSEKPIYSEESIVLSQIMSHEAKTNIEKLYLKAKIFELFSIYFKPQQESFQNCPFLEEEENVEKIRLAKRILIENMSEPLTLQELSQKIDLPMHYLKDGFKQIYGTTVFGFLGDYKMEYARRMLMTKKYQVAEVGYAVGYSTSSHFITAFKKKFGLTPKKIMSKL